MKILKKKKVKQKIIYTAYSRKVRFSRENQSWKRSPNYRKHTVKQKYILWVSLYEIIREPGLG